MDLVDLVDLVDGVELVGGAELGDGGEGGDVSSTITAWMFMAFVKGNTIDERQSCKNDQYKHHGLLVCNCFFFQREVGGIGGGCVVWWFGGLVVWWFVAKTKRKS